MCGRWPGTRSGSCVRREAALGTRRVVALLRGVNNIGATKRIAMADLRVLVEGLGGREVRTLLNSGNVVFSAPGAWCGEEAARLEKALASTCGIPCRVTVLSRAEVAAAVRDNPLAKVADDPSSLLVLVPRVSRDLARLKPLLAKGWGGEKLALGKRVAYVWCARGVADSDLWPAVDRALARSGTARNMATMTKVLAALEGGMPMAENKTKATDASVEGYLGAIEDDRRRGDCEALAKLMKKATKQPAKMWGSSIVGFGSYHYRYESGREGDTCLVGFSSRKGEISVYGLQAAPGAEGLLAKLGKHKTGKGCVYIKALADVDLKVLEKLVGSAAAAKKREHA